MFDGCGKRGVLEAGRREDGAGRGQDEGYGLLDCSHHGEECGGAAQPCRTLAASHRLGLTKYLIASKYCVSNSSRIFVAVVEYFLVVVFM